jgi:hypothetical protein
LLFSTFSSACSYTITQQSPLFITNNLRSLHTTLINLNSVPPSGCTPPCLRSGAQSNSSDNKDNNSKFNLILDNKGIYAKPEQGVTTISNLNSAAGL